MNEIKGNSLSHKDMSYYHVNILFLSMEKSFIIVKNEQLRDIKKYTLHLTILIKYTIFAL